MLLQSAGYTKTLCICPKKFCPSVTMGSLDRGAAEPVVTIVVAHYTDKLLEQWFNPCCLWNGKLCHFLLHGPEIFATF